VAEFPYVYSWRPKLLRTLDRKGQRCRVLVRSKMNSALVEFGDGFKAVVSRNALRKVSHARASAD
jgi:hypothetical protein